MSSSTRASRGAEPVDARRYYDAFAPGYDDGRERGYHALIDDQAAAIVARFGAGRRVLEVGCGTGLVLARLARRCDAVGVDLSPGMLARARDRGLKVARADARRLPFADASVDVACAFKVLAHVPELAPALREMARVVRPGGFLCFDLYNRHSLRYLAKRLGGARPTSARYDEGRIPTRYLSPAEVGPYLPAGTRVVARAGIRVVTPHALVHRLPAVGPLWSRLEWRLLDSPLARFAGFLVYVLQRAPGPA